MEDIVYESEILPELEIEEALTLEQMLTFQPRFVAFSDQDILAYLHQLLKSSPQKAEIFARLHKQVIQDTLKIRDVHKHVTFVPRDLSRKNYEDADFIAEMNDAKQASSYTVQQMGIDRVMFPFVLDQEDIATTSDRPILEHDVDIRLGDYPSRILKTDPIQVAVDRASWNASMKNNHPDYLFDPKMHTILGNMKPGEVSWKPGDPSDMTEWILTKVRPSIQKVLAVISEPIDIHTLHRILGKYGYMLEHLKSGDFELLKTHVRDVLSKDPDIHDDEVQVPIEASKLARTFVGFGDTLQNEGKRASILITDDESMKLQTKYRTLLESVPPLPLQIPLASPAEIAKELRNGTSNIETVAEQLIQWYLRWFLDNVSRFMEKYAQNNVDLDKVESYMRRLQQVGESILLTSTFDFIHQYSDIAELKEGNDTSAYDGAPSIVPQMVFEENANEEFVPSSSMESDTTPEMDALDIFDTNTAATTSHVDMQEIENLKLEPGQKEVILDAWKKVLVVQAASGLPLNVSSVLHWCKQYITRPSRLQQIMTKVPGIAEAIAYRILHPDIQIVAERIQDLHSKEWRESLQQSYKSIHDEWITSTKQAILLIMTKWWMDLCEQSLQGTLHFTPLQGMIQHIHTWSSYGPPMQPDAKSGILAYMTEVAETVVAMDARTTRDDMKSIATERMPTEMEKLKTQWGALQASGQILNKSDRARLLLENTIKAIKSGQSGVDVLNGYLPGLLYLPQLLPAKRVAKKAASWIQGCCAAPLDDSFKADSDWRTQLSALYKIKRFLAKERWSVQARTVLNGFTKESSESNPANTHNACGNKPPKTTQLQDSISASQLFEMDLHKEAWQWIPRSHMDMLTKYPNEVEGWAKKVIDAMYPGEKTKSGAVFKVITQITSMSSLLSFLNRIGKNLREKLKEEQSDLLAQDLSMMKSCLRDIPSGKVSSTMIQYVSTILLAKPANIDHGNLSLPSDMTRQTITSIWNKNYQLCTEWNMVGSMMNATEVQAFITKVREQQKEISLQRLDILSIEDRQTLLDAKNLGLLRIVEFNEIHVDDETMTDEQDRRMDLEGEQDFTMVSRDADPDVDEL